MTHESGHTHRVDTHTHTHTRVDMHESGRDIHESEHDMHESGHDMHESGHDMHESGHDMRESGHDTQESGHTRGWTHMRVDSIRLEKRIFPSFLSVHLWHLRVCLVFLVVGSESKGVSHVLGGMCGVSHTSAGSPTLAAMLSPLL